ncbi:MAG: hypothetical protein ABIF01_04795 [Candidatus Micrarchaeota archaeon]
MPEISTKYYAYGCMGVGVFCIVLAMNNQLNIITAPLAGLFVMGSLAIYKYGYILVPLITKGLRIVEIRDGYEIPPGQEAIVKKVGGTYYASAFLFVRIYESVTDKTMDENQVYTEYFERAISSVKFVAKFSMMVYVKDLTKYRENIETKRAEAQLRLAREKEKSEPDVLRIDKFEREVAMWDGQLARISTGVKPMGAITYIMTTAQGVSKEAAIAAALNQGSELRATVSNALNCEVNLVTGEEMRKCFEWEFFLPSSEKEVEEAVA